MLSLVCSPATLGASLLGNMLAGKEQVKEQIEVVSFFNAASSPLSNFEIHKYCLNHSRFNGFYSRNNLPKIKDGAYVINLDEYKSIRTHWMALYVNGDNITYLNSFEVEDIPKKIKRFRGNKNIINVFRTQAHSSIMCRYFCIGFIDFIIKLKQLMKKNQFRL